MTQDCTVTGRCTKVKSTARRQRVTGTKTQETNMTTKYPTFKEAFEAEILAPLGDAASDYDIDALADTLLIDGTHDGVSFWEPRINLSNGVLLEVAEDYLTLTPTHQRRPSARHFFRCTGGRSHIYQQRTNTCLKPYLHMREPVNQVSRYHPSPQHTFGLSVNRLSKHRRHIRPEQADIL